MHLLPVLPLSAFHLLVSVTWLCELGGFATTLQAIFWCCDAARCSLNVTRRNILHFLAVPLGGLITECLDKVPSRKLFHCPTPSVHTLLPLPGHVTIPKLKWLASRQDPGMSAVWTDCFCFDVIKKHPQRKYIGLGVCSRAQPCPSRVERDSYFIPFFFRGVLQLRWSLSVLVHVISYVKHWLSTALKYTPNFKHCCL